jgi:hypothetical protein
MKRIVPAVAITLMALNTSAQSASPHIDLEVTATSITLGQQSLSDGGAFDEAIGKLSAQTPKPTIYITKMAGPFDRSQHIMGTLLASGLKFYLIGHEAPTSN